VPVRRGALTVRLVLPSRVYVAGTTVTARIDISNSGPPVPFIDCPDPYEVVLSNSRIHQDAVWPACGQQDTIPSGDSVRTVAVLASYTTCAAASPSLPGMPPCLPDGKLPPLPAGTYQAEVIPVNNVLLPAPPPVTVQVVAAAG
jgi:hypothetical protein